MARKSALTIPSVVLTCYLSACAPSAQIDSDAELAIIEETISSCIGWFETKDFDLLFGLVLHDSTYLSVHPNNTVVKGFRDFEERAEGFRDPEFTYVRHEMRDLTINLSDSGDVAWFYCILDDMNLWHGEPANWENTRWTGVLEKKGRQVGDCSTALFVCR